MDESSASASCIYDSSAEIQIPHSFIFNRKIHKTEKRRELIGETQLNTGKLHTVVTVVVNFECRFCLRCVFQGSQYFEKALVHHSLNISRRLL